MISKLRDGVGRLFTPLARWLLRHGVSPDAVTIVGTLGVVVAALWLFPLGYLFAGTMVCWFFAMSDAIDGLMARLSGRVGPWGAFLDSTLDRIADGAIFTGRGGAASYRFLRFRPGATIAGAGGAPALPHIRLDRTLQFLLGDYLA